MMNSFYIFLSILDTYFIKSTYSIFSFISILNKSNKNNIYNINCQNFMIGTFIYYLRRKVSIYFDKCKLLVHYSASHLRYTISVCIFDINTG